MKKCNDDYMKCNKIIFIIHTAYGFEGIVPIMVISRFLCGAVSFRSCPFVEIVFRCVSRTSYRVPVW